MTSVDVSLRQYNDIGVTDISMKEESVAIIDVLILFNTLLLIIYLSAIETLICRREMRLIGSTSFGFAQKTIHDFQNTVLNS